MANRSRNHTLSVRIPAYARALVEILREDCKVSASKIIELAVEAIATPGQRSRAQERAHILERRAAAIRAPQEAKKLAAKYPADTLRLAMENQKEAES